MGSMRSMWDLRRSLSRTGMFVVPVGDRESSTTRMAGPGLGNWRVMI